MKNFNFFFWLVTVRVLHAPRPPYFVNFLPFTRYAVYIVFNIYAKHMVSMGDVTKYLFAALLHYSRNITYLFGQNRHLEWVQLEAA